MYDVVLMLTVCDAPLGCAPGVHVDRCLHCVLCGILGVDVSLCLHGCCCGVRSVDVSGVYVVSGCCRRCCC